MLDRLILPVFPRRPYPYSLYLGRLGPTLRRWRPDAVLCYGEASELGTWQVVRAVRRHCPTARVVVYSFENVDRDFSGFPRCLRRWAERATLARVDAVAAASRSAAERLRRLGLPEAKIRVVMPGASPDEFHPHQAEAARRELAADGDFLIGYVGRLVPEKGLDLVLRALAELPGHCRLAVAGAGPAEPELRGLAAELGLGERVRWLGRVPRERIADHFAALEVLVLPSRGTATWREQFGMVLAEAMLCGTPVIGSDSGAIPEVIGDGGLVFAEDDHRALADHLRRLADDEGYRRELAERARTRAAHLTTERLAAELLAVLRG